MQLDNQESVLLAVGALFLLGLATEYIGRATALPRVTLLLFFGILLGQNVFGVLPAYIEGFFPQITEIALLLVGFLLGGKITIRDLGNNGKAVLCLSLSIVLITVLLVASGLWLFGVPMTLALLLGGIAAATDPAATTDVIRENNASGLFTDTLQGIVAIDDAWGLILFSIILTLLQFGTTVGAPLDSLWNGARELGGSIALGVIIGIPMAYLTGRLKPGEPTLIEALGVVFICGGLANYFQVSFLLSAMVLGCTVSNLAKHHERPFHAIEDIEWPFMILFFVLTGASLQFTSIDTVLPLACLYILFRFAGRLLGSWPGGLIAGVNPLTQRWMGLALLPQAGVASGMALLAGKAFPELSDTLLAVTILATITFELVGPIITRLSLKRVGDIRPINNIPDS